MDNQISKCPQCSGIKSTRLGTSGPLKNHNLCLECKTVYSVENYNAIRAAAQKINDVYQEEKTLQSVLEEFLLCELDVPGGPKEVEKRAIFITKITGEKINIPTLLLEIAKYEYEYMEATYNAP